MNQPAARQCTLFAALVLLPVTAFAGRPLTVDDANTEEGGHAHLEAWVAREPGSTVYNLAPAYAPIDGLELGAQLARDTSAAVTLTGLQAKWRITPKQENGCNAGAVLGWSRASGSPDAASVIGLLSCFHPQRGNAHANLGVTKAGSVAASMNWGVAWERDLHGATPSIEWFGRQGSKPTLQAGLRGNLARSLQLDGSLGRRGGATLYSLGTKLQF